MSVSYPINEFVSRIQVQTSGFLLRRAHTISAYCFIVPPSICRCKFNFLKQITFYPVLVWWLFFFTLFRLCTTYKKSGSLHNRWSRKPYLSKKILCSHHRLNRRQKHQSSFRSLFGKCFTHSLKRWSSRTAILQLSFNRPNPHFLLQCASAIQQLSKGKNKEDRDATSAPELHSLAAAAVEKEYKLKAPAKLQLISSALRSLKLWSQANGNAVSLLWLYMEFLGLLWSCWYLFSLLNHRVR